MLASQACIMANQTNNKFSDQALVDSSFPLQVPSPYAVAASSAKTIPVVTIPYSFSDLTLQTFTLSLKQQLVDAVRGTLSQAANVNIILTNIQSGPVNLALVAKFLDGNTAAAQQLLVNAQQAAAVSNSGSHSPPCSFISLRLLLVIAEGAFGDLTTSPVLRNVSAKLAFSCFKLSPHSLKHCQALPTSPGLLAWQPPCLLGSDAAVGNETIHVQPAAILAVRKMSKATLVMTAASNSARRPMSEYKGASCRLVCSFACR